MSGFLYIFFHVDPTIFNILPFPIALNSTPFKWQFGSLSLAYAEANR